METEKLKQEVKDVEKDSEWIWVDLLVVSIFGSIWVLSKIF